MDRRFLFRWLGGVALGFLSIAVARGAPPRGGPITVLEGGSAWRVRYSWNVPVAKTEGGLVEIWPVDRRGRRPKDSLFRYMALYPPAGWTAADFDDSDWCRRHFFLPFANGEEDLRAGGGGASARLRQLSLRGKFTVTDPAVVRGLRLCLGFRGGAVVYVNSTEIARPHMPAGETQPGAPAEIYPTKAYLNDDGKPWHWYDDRETVVKEVYPLRVRRVEGLAVPGRLLRKGANVLAIEIHASPYPPECVKTPPPWATAGLVDIRLQADGPEGIVPNVAAAPGVRVWNTNAVAPLHDVEYGDPHEPPRPISLAGARNGHFSGRVVVSSDRAIRNLRATASDLIGPGRARIAASTVEVAYGAFVPYCSSAWGGANPPGAVHYGPLAALRDDALLDSPPAVVQPVAKEFDNQTAAIRKAASLPVRLPPAAIQPVWAIVHVPAGAAPGDYRGELTITLDGHQPIRVPLEVKVADWAIPDPVEFASFLGVIQSPDGEALHYGVPFGSARHWELVAAALRLVGGLGPRVLFIPLTAETQYGNDESMVVWVKGPGGAYTHDFARAEKYIDLAVANMGKPTFVVLGVWNPCRGDRASPRRDRPLVTARDGQGGKAENILGPPHGSAEALAFWKPVLTHLRDRLARHGLDGAVLLGFGGDRLPDAATVTMFHAVLPGAGWQATRHAQIGTTALPREGGEVPVGLQSNVWGGWDNWDPDVKRVYGWRFPQMRTWLDRGLWDASPMVDFRTACEQPLLADRRGLGQLGADFWPLKTAAGKGIPTIANLRFPVTHQTNVGIYTGQLLYGGPNGPVPTVRYELLRENLQECEARIFLERLLLAEPCRLPPELASKAQAVLDERTRWHRMRTLTADSALSWPYSGWQERTLRLYEAAGEAAKAVASE